MAATSENQSPTFTYADVTTADGHIFSTEFGAEVGYGSNDQGLSVEGETVECSSEDSGGVPFTITATCDG